jgi:hypothetical protein
LGPGFHPGGGRREGSSKRGLHGNHQFHDLSRAEAPGGERHALLGDRGHRELGTCRQQLGIHKTAGWQTQIDRHRYPLGRCDAHGERARADREASAFGVFGPASLVHGTVHGEHAAQAALLSVATIPLEDLSEPRVGGSVSVRPDALAELEAAFYLGAEALVSRVRAWERSAPKGELMTPDRLADMWTAMLDASASSGEPLLDPYGRRLELWLLGDQRLAQIGPREVVASGTRLPEDVESWVDAVNRRRP